MYCNLNFHKSIDVKIFQGIWELQSSTTIVAIMTRETIEILEELKSLYRCAIKYSTYRDLQSLCRTVKELKTITDKLTTANSNYHVLLSHPRDIFTFLTFAFLPSESRFAKASPWSLDIGEISVIYTIDHSLFSLFARFTQPVKP